MLVRSVSLLVVLSTLGCAAAQQEVALPRWFSGEAEAVADARPAPAPLVENDFVRDNMGSLSEGQLREILAAPVFLEEKARLGIVRVSEGYGADAELPIAGVPGALAKTLDATGQFELVSEVSTDFPATGSIAGLRELAARYRCDDLLLYRHRFVDRVYASGWAWTWATVVGPLAAPVNVLEAEGVLEATLFDVKTGTILFTSFERVKDKKEENVLDTERKQKELRERLLEDATKKTGADVVEQIGAYLDARKSVSRTNPLIERLRDKNRLEQRDAAKQREGDFADVRVVGGEEAVDRIFEHYGTNPTVDTAEEAFSTFSVDVDTASYAIARANLEQGALPDPAAVRVEELVNNFRYDYPPPKSEPFSVVAEAFPSPNRKGYHLLLLGLKGKVIEESARPPANLVFVVDVSGSMDMDNRLGSVKRALNLLIDKMREDDTVAIVTYGDVASVVLEPTSGAQKERIRGALSRLTPSGSTNAQAGICSGTRSRSARSTGGRTRTSRAA